MSTNIGFLRNDIGLRDMLFIPIDREVDAAWYGLLEVIEGVWGDVENDIEDEVRNVVENFLNN